MRVRYTQAERALERELTAKLQHETNEIVRGRLRRSLQRITETATARAKAKAAERDATESDPQVISLPATDVRDSVQGVSSLSNYELSNERNFLRFLCLPTPFGMGFQTDSRLPAIEEESQRRGL
jgi:hypothetical protein